MNQLKRKYRKRIKTSHKIKRRNLSLVNDMTKVQFLMMVRSMMPTELQRIMNEEFGTNHTKVVIAKIVNCKIRNAQTAVLLSKIFNVAVEELID